MNELPFTFSNALLHLFKTEGPKGFVWKFALAYGLVSTLIYALMMWSFAPLFSVMLSPDIIDNPEAADAAFLGNIGSIVSGYAIATIGGLLLWVLFEAASQRRYMRGEGLSLRLGADEGRLFVVGLIFFGVFLASYLGFALIVGLVFAVAATAGDSGVGVGILLMIILIIGYFIGFIFLMVRLSPAASLTIRDRRIRFQSAWRVSRGKGWVIFGSWVLLYIIMYAILLVAYLILIVIAIAAMAPAFSNGEDPSAAFGAMLSPVALVGLFVVGFLFASLIGVFLHAFGGPAALAAKTDPEWVDQAGITETFG